MQQATKPARERAGARINVVLIHGTILFARFKLLRSWFGTKPLKWSGWLRPSSLFCRRLRNSLAAQGTTVRIHRFRWTGGNSDEDRIAAAQRLRRKLQAWGKSTPKEQWILAAHSHGGNVALEALKEPEAARFVKGIAALGTPFFQHSPRYLTPAVNLRYRFSGFFTDALVIGFALLAQALVQGFTLSAVAGFLAYVAIAVPGFLFSAIRKRERMQTRLDAVEQKAKQLVEEVQYPMIWSIPLINIESKIREAKLAIGVGYCLQRIPEIGFNVFGSTLWIAPYWMAEAPLMAFFVGPVTTFFGLLLSLFVVLQAALFLPAILLLWFYNQIVIGGQSLKKSFYVSTTVGFLPHEAWGELRVRRVRPEGRRLALSHCSIYEDPAIVDEIAQFVRDCVEDKPCYTPVVPAPVERILPIKDSSSPKGDEAAVNWALELRPNSAIEDRKAAHGA